MKSILGLTLGLMVGTANVQAQSIASQQTQAKVPTPTPYAITTQDANTRVWQSMDYRSSPSGGVITNTQSYTELATGLNHLVNGQWVESSEQIDILPIGIAAATNGQHQAYFPGDIYQGHVALVTPDGLELDSRPLALSYFDGTNAVVIAELTNSIGVVSGINQVIYPNAFTGSAGFKVDLRYTYTKMGFEQDVILRSQPPTPESLGLNPDTARLQIMTEFFSPPQPVVLQTKTLPIQAGLTLSDQRLAFGTMQMVQGRAFSMGNNAQDAGALVSKHWVQVSGRNILIEEVPVDAILEGLAALPLTAMNSSPGKHSHTAHLQLPPQRLAQNPSKAMLIAKAELPGKGMVLDYATLNTSQTNKIFQGDTTYYLSGNVNLFGTNTTFEGGTVLKYASNVVLTVETPVTWQGAAYRPVFMISKNDNSVGQSISGANNDTTNYAAATALYFDATTAGTNLVLQHLKIGQAQTAVAINGGSGHVLSHVQLVNCGNGLALTNTTVALRNALMDHVLTNFTGSSSTCSVEHLTSDTANWLNSDIGSNLFLTNCLLVAVTNNGNYSVFQNVNTNSSHSGIFQTVGAGAHYLISGSTNRNVGTGNINPSLLADLQKMTTYPPIIYSNMNVNGAWATQPIRDTDTPDLGYHYDALDYEVSGIQPYGTLTLSNGVAVATFYQYGVLSSQTDQFGGTWSVPGSGIYGSNTIVLASFGTAQMHNHISSFQNVQEQPSKLGYQSGVSMIFAVSNPDPSKLQAQFTDFDGIPGIEPGGMGNGGILFMDTMCLNMRDCRVGPGSFTGNVNNQVGPTNQIINNLFERTSVEFYMYNTSVESPLNFYNNTMRNSTLTFYENPVTSPAPWIVRDNLFDSNTISVTDSTGLFVHDHNAYLKTSVISGSESNDVVLTNFTYAVGPLGNYYQSSTNLLNQGSTTADQRGLYHYTVQTNLISGLEVPEGTSTVSIGYHYVATDPNGNPLDNDGDGFPDYIEDANGNGLVDSGETDWQNANDLGLKIWITRPRNGSTIP